MTRQRELIDAIKAAEQLLGNCQEGQAIKARAILLRAVVGTFYSDEDQERVAREIADGMVAIHMRKVRRPR